MLDYYILIITIKMSIHKIHFYNGKCGHIIEDVGLTFVKVPQHLYHFEGVVLCVFNFRKVKC